MAKPRRPRGPRPTWEPKIVGADATEPAGPGSESPLPDAASAPPETETSERALMAAVDPAPALPEPPLPATVPAEAAHPETSAFEAAYEAATPDPAPSAEPDVDGVEAPAPVEVTPAAPADVAPAAFAPADAFPPEPAVADFPPVDSAPADAPPPEPMVAETVVPRPVAVLAAPAATAASVAGFRIAFDPERFDMAGIGDVIAGYVRGETQAAAAHLRALTGARSPADMIRLQVGEMQRAADASLTCWSSVARKAGRAFALR